MTLREGRKSPSFLIPILFCNESKIYQCIEFEVQLGTGSFKLCFLIGYLGFEGKISTLNPYPFKVTCKSLKATKNEGLRKRDRLSVNVDNNEGGCKVEILFFLALISELEAGRYIC